MRLLLLFGGRSAEHDVSVASAVAMLRALKGSDIEVTPLGISREGRWRIGQRANAMLESTALFAAGGEAVSDLTAISPAVSSVAQALRDVDVVFPLLHGPYGEDGTVQGLLELADVPYVGSGVLGSALSMDKLAMKAAFRSEGLPVAPYEGVTRARWRSEPGQVRAELEGALGYPMFVKPANMGSSVGVSKVHHSEELSPAMEEAARYDRRLIVEQGLDARELECGVLGNDSPEASVVGEILPGAEFYDYEAKYVGEHSATRIPAELPRDISREIRRIAVAAFQAVDAAGMARVDFFLVGTDQIYLNEINTIPGFTPISQFPRLWQASGVEYVELVRRLAQLAIERHAERNWTPEEGGR
ncbi:MAG: D-alanine--D-alanine ligase [Chloroflexota bacterium]|nr:D-alanine--D-alanine ligase [Chloroflexota bacterium]